MTALASGTRPAPGVHPSNDDDGILNKQQAAAFAGLSLRTWERHEAEGTCPPRVQLGTRRIGYWRSDVREWLRHRTGPKKAA